MIDFKKSINIARIQFLSFKYDKQLWIVLFSFSSLVFLKFSAISKLSFNLNEKVNFAVPIIMFEDQYLIFSSLFVILVFFHKLPLKWDWYFVSRMNYWEWLLGQIIFIWSVVLIFIFILNTLVFMRLNNQVMLSNDWGKFIGTINYYPNLLIEYNSSFSFPQGIYQAWSPISAFFGWLLLVFLTVSFLGLLTLFFNSIREGMGVWMFLIFVFLDFGQKYFPWKILKYLSPVSWMTLSNIKATAFDTLPTHSFILGSLFFLNSLLLLILLLIGRYNLMREKVLMP